jgi:hypothetical protein
MTQQIFIFAASFFILSSALSAKAEVPSEQQTDRLTACTLVSDSFYRYKICVERAAMQEALSVEKIRACGSLFPSAGSGFVQCLDKAAQDEVTVEQVLACERRVKASQRSCIGRLSADD